MAIQPLQNFWLLSFAIWPGIVLLSALLNMGIWGEFGFTELIVDYVIGFTLGIFFWFYVHNDERSFVKSFFLVFSHGLFGVLRIFNVIPNNKTLFWWAASCTVGATLLTAALDHAAVGIGTTMSAGGVVIGILIFILKAPFALFTSAIGLLIFIAGLFNDGIGDGRSGFLGGVVYTEWSPTTADTHATTVGCTVHCWKNTFSSVMEHELYHSRQYIYMRDWLIPSWCVCFIFAGAGNDNPIEVVAYKIQ
jgi:hypothetical protein